MFEKEAEEWADKMYPCDGQAQRYLLMGAVFGYNKANEWHYVKDEEMAEEYANKQEETIPPFSEEGGYCWNQIAEAFLAGLKAGRPQWHDLRKDPKDLPKEDKYYLIVTKLNNYYISKFRGTCWIGKCNAYVSEDMVIAWCEIPTFDKE